MNEGNRQESLLPVYKILGALSFEELFSLPETDLLSDWFGNPLPARTCFTAAVDEARFYFGTQCFQAPWYEASHCKGEFVEDLWQKDVAEIFFCEDGSSRYQEFNLSPGGAWWSAVFSDYRLEELVKIKAEVETYSRIEPTSWKAGLALTLDSFSVRINLDNSSRANVSFIINGQDRRFLSFVKLQSGEPDFHKLAAAANLKLLER